MRDTRRAYALAALVPALLLITILVGRAWAGSYSSLQSYYGNVGVSTDTAYGGDFDGYGDSYSYQALRAVGYDIKPGVPDNVVAAGQAVSLSGVGSSLTFIGAASHRSASGGITVSYTDGSTTQSVLGFTDWTRNGGASPVSYGNVVVATMPYRNTGGSQDHKTVYLYSATVAVDPGRTLSGVTLPEDPHIHIFSVAVTGSVVVGTPTTAPTATYAPPATSTATATTAVPTATTAPPTATTAPTPAGHTIALGAMVDGAPNTIGALDAFNALVYPNGGHVAAVNFFRNWEDTSANQFPASDLDAIKARGAMPFLTWGSCQQGQNNPRCADSAVANGSYDVFLHVWARAAASYGKPFYLRFDHEMNGFWYPWNPGSNGNTAADFVAMWRHVHDLLAADGVSNARWVWCPNTTPGGASYTASFPGDAYVDYTCLDGYNWGPIHPRGWHSFHDEFAHDYATLAALSARPMIIGETASTEVGGDKTAWIADAFYDLPRSFPRVVALLWFNANKETDWRVNSSPSALGMYRAVANTPQYAGTLN